MTKTKVELRPSRIRREPPAPKAQPLIKQLSLGGDAQRDQWTVIIGVVMFGLAISFLILWVSDYTSK